MGFGFMAVAIDDGGKPGGGWVEWEIFEIVEEVDEYAADLDDFGVGELVCPSSLVDVAADSRDGRNGFKLGEDERRADVACVKDPGDPAEGVDDLRPNDGVGVGDKADVYSVCNHRTRVILIRIHLDAGTYSVDILSIYFTLLRCIMLHAVAIIQKCR